MFWGVYAAPSKFKMSFITQANPAESLDTPKYSKESPESHVQQTHENEYILPNPKNVVQTVEYDYKTDRYKVTEKVGGVNVKPPMYLTYEEYLELSAKKEKENTLKSRNSASTLVTGKKESKSPVISFKDPTQGVFGEGGIDIKPQGNLDVVLGYNHNTIKNPLISPLQQSQGLLNFDMNINLSVMAKIGDKFQNTLRYNNQGGFGFEGQRVKLAYNGKEDEIIRNIEAGDVSFDVPTQLISGSQSLFGIKSELQFGKLNIKSVLSQQRANKQTKIIENGAELQKFEINADQYDQNRHFFLAQYFRDNFEKSLKSYPLNLSQIQITNVEVWISNRNVATQNVRDVVAFQDLGEVKPYSPRPIPNPSQILPDNSSNSLYSSIKLDDNVRNVNSAMMTLQSYGYKSFQDFEKSYVRKLAPTEYVLNPQLGFISLNTTLQANDILAVSYQYTYNGKIYQVGDLSRDITLPDTSSSSPSRLTYLKLLKGSNVNPTFPMWQLMMKNIYSLGAYQVSQDNFRLDIYYNDPGGGPKRYIPKGNLQKEPITRIMNLDRLNINSEPYPDGIFDFVPNVTIMPTNGKVIFPVLEPFGSHLKEKLIAAGNSDLVAEYVYPQLYDSTLFVAQQFPEFNRFVIRGTYQSASNKRIQLGFNLPQGSVKVLLNGSTLVENQDYTVDYNLGYVELMDHILSSGGKIQVDFENSSAFSLQVKNFTGIRAEYRANELLTIGTTYERLSERPFNNKITYGEDPISNQIIGGDITYNSNAPFITKLLDKLPFYTTNEASSIKTYGEIAHLIPGHNTNIGNEGTIYIDDFEGATIGTNFGNPATMWRLSSTPQDAKNEQGNYLFNESKMFDSLVYGYNRAKLSWYNIASLFYFQNSSSPTLPPNVTDNIYMRPYRVKQVFPARNVTSISDLLQVLDLAFFPKQRGPYNFEQSESPTPGISSGVNKNGSLKDPESRWGGIQRSIDNTNFETNNIEYIQFWLLDPFTKNKNNKGDLYFNLGYVSEDVLKDSRLAFEQGLEDKQGLNRNLIAESRWSWVPKVTPIINAFDNDPNKRSVQDIGLDGSSDADERTKFKNYLDKVKTFLDPDAYTIAESDPSTDNFKHYLNENFSQDKNIIERYKDFNGVENNTPVTNSGVPQSNYATPDNEDINKDNTLNETEAYYQYRVKLYPGMDVENNPYIISKTVTQGVRDPDGDSATWYQFRIPIKEYNHKVGNIGDFRNIQFIRMFLTNFKDSAILRMTELQFIRNQWRKYNTSIQAPTDYIPQDNGEEFYFNVGGVSLEENASKTPVAYVTPPGIVREVGLDASASAVSLNEQALRLSFCNLKDGDARASFKNIDFDFRQFKKMKLYFHAENSEKAINPMRDNEVSAFIRLGSDFKENYYEYEIPLKVTQPKANGTVYNNKDDADRRAVWPDSNQMTILLEDLVNAKFKRNEAKFPTNTPYTLKLNDVNITVVGNPDLGIVKTAMIGVRNRAINDKYNFSKEDDGMPKCGEVWANELRLEGLNEEGGTAAIASVKIKLADLGEVMMSGSMHTVGWGQVQQRVNERKQDDYFQYNVTTSLQLGKFFPKALGLQLPFFYQTTKGVSTPKYDPFSRDIKTINQKQSILNAYGQDSSDRYYESILTTETRNGFNFSNVRIVPTKPSTKSPLFGLRYFSASYAYNSTLKTNPFVKQDWLRTYSGDFGYSYAAQPKYIEPFKHTFKKSKKAMDWFKAINFNLIPNSLTFKNAIDRQFGIFEQRMLSGESFQMPSQYLKSFTWNRNYGLDYNPIRPLNVSFTAANMARIDEPQGDLSRPGDVDSIWKNIKKLGRTTSYNQTLALKYSLPFAKIQPLSFLTSSINYNSGFTWTTGPQVVNSSGDVVQSPQGNIINNNQSVGTSLNIKMNKLYSMIPFIKNADIENKMSASGLPKEQREAKEQKQQSDRDKIIDNIGKAKEALDKLKKEKKDVKADEKLTDSARKVMVKAIKVKIKEQRKKIKELKQQKSQLTLVPDILKVVTQPLLAVRDIDLSYNIENSTTISGYTQQPKYFGMDLDNQNHLSPEFVFGSQPGTPLFSPPDKYARFRWLEDFSNKGFLTKDTLFNMPFMQSNAKVFKARMTLEPYKGFKINLNWESNYTQNYTEIYKYNATLGKFEHLNPMESGSYTYSDINLLSWGNKLQRDGSTQNLVNFDKNSQFYALMLNEANPNSYNQVYVDPITGVTKSNYKLGYGPMQQDVLINSFLTTYRGQEAKRGDNVSPFSKIPLPNWNITFTGLTNFKLFKDIFTNVTLKHGYSSKTTIGNFNSELRYFGGGEITNPVRIDSLNNNFIPYYYIPSVTIAESFNPLIGIDIRMKNSLEMGFEYRSTRAISMSLIDYLLVENESNSFTFRTGVALKKLKLPFNKGGKQVVLDKDVKISCNVTYTNSSIVNHKLSQGINVPVGGNIRLSISPNIEYQFEKFKISLFYDYNMNEPKISNSFKTINGAGGFKMGFTL